MNHLHSRTLVLLSILLIGTASLTGCSKSPQQKYDSATSQLQDAKKALSDSKQKVASQQKEVDEAQKKLGELQKKVDAKRQKVVTATQAVDKTVNDEVLFRTLQKNLLDKDKFSDSAISVGVHNLVVTLSGVVPDQDTHDQAIKVTRNQAGVADVRDQLQIGDQDNSDASDANTPDQGASQSQSQPPAKTDDDNNSAPKQPPAPAQQDGGNSDAKPDNNDNAQPSDTTSGNGASDSSNAT